MMLLNEGWLPLSTALVAGLALSAGPLFRTRCNILGAQFVAGAAFAAHYATLGIPVAAAVNVLGCAQTLAAMHATGHRSARFIGFSVAVLMVLVGSIFWENHLSTLSVVAMGLIALARMQCNQFSLRLLLLAGGAVWVVHDILAGAWFAVAADIATLLTGAVGFLVYVVGVRVLRPGAAG